MYAWSVWSVYIERAKLRATLRGWKVHHRLQILSVYTMKPVTPALAHQVGDQSVHAFRVNLAIAAPTRRVHRRFPLLVEENHRRWAAGGRCSARG